jgi:hypothetical protein
MLLVKKKPPIPTSLFNLYWYFAAERQSIFFKKLQDSPAPWTDDPILLKYRFTNAYRASDRTSQYLIRNIISPNDTIENSFFKIILFKTFNKIETWDKLTKSLNKVDYSGYSFKKYDDILSQIMTSGSSIYSAAYIMPSPNFGYKKKHQNHLSLIEHMMKSELVYQLTESKSMGEAYKLLLNNPGIGEFLAFQYIIDLNYSTILNFSEMSFVLAGPGARDGIRKCFSHLNDWSDSDIIRMVAETQREEFERREISFKTLWGRDLQLIDCQNLFCEISKYSRISHPEIRGSNNRKKIKQKYQPNSQPIAQPLYPEKWGLSVGDIK